MLARAVGDFRLVGFFKKVKGSEFALMDTLLYSPLCVPAVPRRPTGNGYAWQKRQGEVWCVSVPALSQRAHLISRIQRASVSASASVTWVCAGIGV